MKVGHQDFGKEGDLPTFTIRKKNDDGQMVEVTYKLNGPIVRRVLTPGRRGGGKGEARGRVGRPLWSEIEARRGSTRIGASHHKHK